MEQVAARKVGESGTYYFRQAVWSALMISSAINTMMILLESGPSLSLMFIVNNNNSFVAGYTPMGLESHDYAVQARPPPPLQHQKTMIKVC